MNFAVVGAGFSGAVLAQELAKAGHNIEVFDSRNHIAGNCYTERDQKTQILLHKYGPHIFHTDSVRVWNYVNNFIELVPYINRVKITANGGVYSLPINLHTINQYFNKTLSPCEALKFIKSLSVPIEGEVKTFEDQALKFIGKDLYEAFFKGYTIKQWGLSPEELPASILKRLPVRFNYDDNYFNHKFQGMPKEGYTPFVDALLGHQNIRLHLNSCFNSHQVLNFDHVFYTGPLDAWFNYDEGRLGYRTLDFEREEHALKDYQGCAVMNYGSQDIPYTRISEHKHFAPWEDDKDTTLIFKEYSRACEIDDVPYYPIRLVEEKNMLKKYILKANSESKVSFMGRLGTYRYIDMDQTIEEALNAGSIVLESIENKLKIPQFFVNPS